MDRKEPMSIAFDGNIVDKLLEYAVNNNIHIDLLSDQTSVTFPATTAATAPEGLNLRGKN